MDLITPSALEGPAILLAALVVIWLGKQLNRHLPWLENHNIPIAVSGGIACSILIALLYLSTGIKITFDMAVRDLLLLCFFSSVGLAAKFSTLMSGGRTLIVLLLCSIVLLFGQHLIGVSVAALLSDKPAYGLFVGSLAFAGGHGTAIAWGGYWEQLGLDQATNIGVAAATFGLIVGGVLGGLVGGQLIKRNNLSQTSSHHWRYRIAPISDEDEERASPLDATFHTLLCLSVCVTFGELLNRGFLALDIKLPDFLTALLVGVALTNLSDAIKRPLDNRAINRAGELCLHLFLAMSLMSIQLWTLTDAFVPLMLVLFLQMALITMMTIFVVFRFTGGNYDAAVISSGFIGLGMGATPVAMANMQAITSRYGPSTKAFLIVPLIGAFFIDICNAVITKLFTLWPLLSQGLNASL